MSFECGSEKCDLGPIPGSWSAGSSCVRPSSVVMLSTVDGALGEPSQGRNTRLPEASVSPVARPSEPCLKAILWASHCMSVFLFLSV